MLTGPCQLQFISLFPFHTDATAVRHPAAAFCRGGLVTLLEPLPQATTRCFATPPNTNIHTLSMEIGGLDSDGRQFESAAEMWSDQVGDPTKKTDWYRQGVGYWEAVEASVDGVLGGYGHVNEADIKDSEAFLNLLLEVRIPRASSATPNQRHLVALGKNPALHVSH